MRRKLRNIAFCLLVSVLVTAPYTYNATAQTPQQKITEMKQKISGAEKEYSDALKQKEYYDAEIEALAGDIYEVDKIIGALESEIAEQNKKIDETNDKLEKKEDSYHKRLRALQHRGSLSYLDVLFGAESFSDFLLRVSLVSDLIEHDKNEINEINELKQSIIDAKAVVEESLAAQKDARSLIVDQKNKLQQMSDKQEAAMKSLMSDKAKYQAELEKAERAKAESDRQAAQITSRSGNGTLTAASKSGFMWPLPTGGRITCHFGYRTDPFPSNHTGIDIALATGNPIVASKAGTVASAVRSNTGYGNCIIINHGDGTSTRYAHCSKLYVSAGQKVEQGETIAAVGSTGLSTGPHLHFEIYMGGTRVDPYPYIK